MMIKSYIIILVLFSLCISLIAQNKLLIPESVSGNLFELNLNKGKVQFFDGKITATFGVNSNILGPTLVMNQGDKVEITVNNNLPDKTTIHWHGMHVAPENDGGPHTVIDPEASWNPSFEVLDKAGTYWYHPHLHQKTNEHVSKGIAGLIIVKDLEEAKLNLPRNYGVDDFPLVIQTKDFDSNNQIVSPSNSDDVLMVNATIDASLDVPAQVIRFRLLNGSSQRIFNIGLSNNNQFHQIASDGGLLEHSIELNRLRLAPGERAEILINFKNQGGKKIHLKSYASELPNGIYGARNPGMMSMMTLNGYNPNPLNGSDFNLLEFKVVEKNENPVLDITKNLTTIVPFSEKLATTKRSLVFTPKSMGMNQLNGHFLINGTSFNMDVVNYTIPLNNVEIWSITNQSTIAHPFHIHDVQFYILDRNGTQPSLSERGRKDVVLVNPMETVRFITKFEDFANPHVPFMYHCHMLVHEDDGMMGQFVVVDDSKTGITSNQESQVKIYPNPNTDGFVKISSSKIIHTAEIYNLNGVKIHASEFLRNKEVERLNISALKAGIYVIKITDSSSVSIYKITKQK